MTLTLFTNTFLVDATPWIGTDPEWIAATVAEQEQALINATRVLDDTTWLGYAVSPTQVLSWPRASFTYYDSSLALLVTTDSLTVPTRLSKATAFLALHYLRYPSAIQGYDANYDELTVGPITLKNTNATSDPGRVPLIPRQVSNLIAPLTTNSSELLWWRAN